MAQTGLLPLVSGISLLLMGLWLPTKTQLNVETPVIHRSLLLTGVLDSWCSVGSSGQVNVPPSNLVGPGVKMYVSGESKTLYPPYPVSDSHYRGHPA